ncbi:hypothetical protein, partial [Streptomyces sp. MB09-02B]|uniref:hypothetical protein n=1 Tax=Streptomyces sp. MB09-02B TaxID=3028667 RepID=UPI0029AD77D7
MYKKQGPPGPSGRPSLRKLQLGGLIDAFYFLGPDDVHGFFRADSGGGGALVAAVEAYFARKYAVDPDFWTDFGTVVNDPAGGRRPLDLTDPDDAAVWEARRKEFVRFYTVRAGGSYSLGCHDEWNILVRLNRARAGHPAYGPGELIATYYGERARSMGESELETSPALRGQGEDRVARGTDGGAGAPSGRCPRAYRRPAPRPSVLVVVATPQFRGGNGLRDSWGPDGSGACEAE